MIVLRHSSTFAHLSLFYCFTDVPAEATMSTFPTLIFSVPILATSIEESIMGKGFNGLYEVITNADDDIQSSKIGIPIPTCWGWNWLSENGCNLSQRSYGPDCFSLASIWGAAYFPHHSHATRLTHPVLTVLFILRPPQKNLHVGTWV